MFEEFTITLVELALEFLDDEESRVKHDVGDDDDDGGIVDVGSSG